jgi:hypothetical protein
MKAFLANVMDAYVYAGDQLLFTSKALTDSSISIGITAEEVRGGKGNKLIGRYFHDSSFGLTLQDALFELGYIAHNVGSQVVSGTSGMLTEEQITATGSGALTVSGTPYDFLSLGTIGWIAKPGSDEWSTFTFSGSSATGVTLADGSAIIDGDTYCVKYMSEAPCDEVVISADFVPDEVSVVLKGDLYKASKGNDVSTSSIIGHIEVDVPRFQLEGSMDISLSSSGAAQIPFSGQALVTMEESCEGGGYYAVVKEFETSANWYDNLVAFALEGSDSISIVKDTTKKLNIYGIYSNGSAKLIKSSNLKFTATSGAGTVSDGVLTAADSAGTGTITVECSGSTNPKPSVKLVIDVTVTAS